MGSGIRNALVFTAFIPRVRQPKCINDFMILIPQKGEGDGMAFFGIPLIEGRAGFR